MMSIMKQFLRGVEFEEAGLAKKTVEPLDAPTSAKSPASENRTFKHNHRHRKQGGEEVGRLPPPLDFVLAESLETRSGVK